MDWIEEIVQKMKKKISDASLRTSLLVAILVSVIAAFVAFVFTRGFIYGWIRVVVNRYTTMEYFMDMQILTDNTGIPMHIQMGLLILKFLYSHSFVLYMLLAEYIGVRWFFRNKMQPGIDSMHTAVGYLTLGDLGHEKNYLEKNEIGEVCDEIEKLRKQMTVMKQQEWEMQSEQSSINAAFAHDLRTPLTVMKGYTEFLMKYQPEGKVSEEMLLEKLSIMHQHQERLLDFSKTMTEIQNIEMRELHCAPIAYTDFLSCLQTIIEELGKQSGKQIIFQSENEVAQTLQISIDQNLVIEVCENLISNAIRYASSRVWVQVNIRQQYLQCYIEDDGSGFSPKALKEAKTLYYSEEKGSSHHFGMGLYISEKLCKKHGGTLTIINSTEGGAICAAEFNLIK